MGYDRVRRVHGVRIFLGSVIRQKNAGDDHCFGLCAFCALAVYSDKCADRWPVRGRGLGVPRRDIYSAFAIFAFIHVQVISRSDERRRGLVGDIDIERAGFGPACYYISRYGSARDNYGKSTGDFADYHTTFLRKSLFMVDDSPDPGSIVFIKKARFAGYNS